MRGNSTINDYIDKLKEKFSYLSVSDIRAIINYGWKMFYLANLAGCDTLLVSQTYNYWIYTGDLCKDPIKHFNYYKRQLARKIKFLYRKSNQQWDGYYYCFLKYNEYQEFIRPKKGRKRHLFKFDNKISFKSKDVCSLHFNIPGCIIRYKSFVDLGFQYYSKQLVCKDPEIVSIREVPLKFKDVLVINNKYECL